MSESDALVIIGGGAAGMSAACFAAERGVKVILLEKNEKLGRKLGITGKGRCNLTNNTTPDGVIRSVVRNPRFLESAVRLFPPSSVMEWFEGAGCPLKTERGDRVFPVSDRAADVVGTLLRMLHRLGVEIRHEKALSIETETKDGVRRVVGVRTDKGLISASRVILATGGKSYPVTGSDGDGYRFAEALGHTVKPARPSLIPLVIKEEDCREMMGLSLKNTALRLTKGDSGKTVYEDFGEMLFTHFGVSGPMILSCSAHMEEETLTSFTIHLDLKPALDEKTLDRRILSDFAQNANRDFINALSALLPQKMIAPVVRRCGIPEHQKVHDISKEQRAALRRVIKDFTLHPIAFRPIEEAIITNGGVVTKEINPKTMESRLVKGLHFAGEIIDVDAYTGGFNLQIAFSTAMAAAKGISNREVNSES